MKTKSLDIITRVIASFFFVFSALQANGQVTQAEKGSKTTKIKVNGLSADVFLVDGSTMGRLSASKDQIANTSSLDFSYVFPEPTNPDFLIFIQGAGEIPNNAFTVTSSSAHLAVTTAFTINRCVFNTITGDMSCGTITTPSTFNLTWATNALETQIVKTKSTTMFGPVITKFQGDFTQRSATVMGNWEGHVTTDLIGYLIDTNNTTIIREITVQQNP